MKGNRRKKKAVGIQLDVEVIKYFKEMAEREGLPYQGLINYTLRQCIRSGFHITAHNIPLRTA